MSKSLFERLGGTEGVTRIAHDVVQNHWENPVISKRFATFDLDKLKKALRTSSYQAREGQTFMKGRI